MTVAIDCVQRSAIQAMVPLEDRFEVIKQIGDGSFGSVALARVRGAGAGIARRGTMVSRSALYLALCFIADFDRLPSRP